MTRFKPKELEVQVVMRLKRVHDKTLGVTFLEQKRGLSDSNLCKWLKARPFLEAGQDL